jgi:hypothetical protein
MNIGGWIKRNSSTILTCLGAGGFVSTVVLAIKATPKAMDKIQDAAITKGEDILAGRREGTVNRCKGGFEMPKLTVLETVMACGKEYIEKSRAGQAVGWVYDKNREDHGDNWVDFGIQEVYRKRSDKPGDYEKVFLLDFNVDGPIMDHAEDKGLITQ